MVKKYTCSFCGSDVEPGTGSIYVKPDGSLLYHCSSKCRRSDIYLKRRARRLKWTDMYEERIRRRAHTTRAKKAKKSKPKAKTADEKPKAKKTAAKKRAKPKAKKKADEKSKAKAKKPTKESKSKKEK